MKIEKKLELGWFGNYHFDFKLITIVVTK